MYYWLLQEYRGGWWQTLGYYDSEASARLAETRNAWGNPYELRVIQSTVFV
jgi:hypothetical protein